VKRTLACLFVFALLFTACSKKDAAEPTASADASATATPTPTPCVLQGGSQTQQSDSGTGEIALVTDVRPNAEGCPRVVFEFKDHVAGYKIGYAEPPFTECGSGATIQTSSWHATAFIDVHLEPSASVDLTHNGEQTYSGPRDIDANGAVLKHLKVTCDFEAVFDWIIGLDAKHDFKVSTLDNPARLVIDISAS